MNTLKGWISTLTLASILIASNVTANAGTIIAGFTPQSPETCTENQTQKIEEKNDLGGIIIAGIGDIIAGLTGIIIAGATDEPTDCGIIIAG